MYLCVYACMHLHASVCICMNLYASVRICNIYIMFVAYQSLQNLAVMIYINDFSSGVLPRTIEGRTQPLLLMRSQQPLESVVFHHLRGLLTLPPFHAV